MIRAFPLTALALSAALASACATSRNLDESVSDFAGGTELKAVLFTDRSRDYSDVDITIFEGRLLLTGTMRSEDGRRDLIANAWKADAIEQVIDELFIGDRTSVGQGFEDARIDQTLRARLIADNDVISSRYKIAVSDAVVYLLGEAKSVAEHETALRLAQSVAGVEKVVSHVLVAGAPPPASARAETPRAE